MIADRDPRQGASQQATRIRGLIEDDTDDIVELYARAATVDPRIGPIHGSDWERFVRQPQNHCGRDFRVALSEGRLVGLAESSLRDQAERRVRFFKLIVDPAMRRRGIGSALLAELLTLDQSNDALSLQTLAARDWPAGLAFLGALGFGHIESEISMRCSTLTAPPAAQAEGFSLVRVAAPADHAVDIARIHNAAFASDAAFRHTTPAEMARLIEHDAVWIATDTSGAVGFCRLELENDLIWLESIAVDPACQNRGLGSALAFRALSAAGLERDRPAGLNVSSSNPAALSVYERLGFVTVREMYRFSARHSDVGDAMALRR
ncbi:GNAT family N-acetyltransferase [Bosea sp. 685]|uniref:GNAT family N-acetyltransferase n=1 Tax=Bosea sp. 685 TaxID=3080057 RepID=UPI002892CCB6|nr:GNAT family N-acetyltransferase [Bosea sp. 685]WNJ92471.1 GNAT family N-acetyltransferase [Bosea sp. 685]